MSQTFLAFGGHRSTYKCIRQCYMPYLYKNIIKNINVHSAMQYCISMKEEDVHLTKQNIDELSHDVHNEEKINRFSSNKTFREDIVVSKRIERLYQQPKTSLLEIYKIVCQELNDQTVLTSSCKQDSVSELWEFTYNVKWPNTMSFKGASIKKSTACKNAALKCLEWLEVNRKLKFGKPLVYTKQQIQQIQEKPCELSVATEILDNMEKLVEIYRTKIDIQRTDNSFIPNIYTTILDCDAFGYPSKYIANINLRNRLLRSRLTERRIRHADLPIFEFRDKILSMLERSQILLIEGDTGCGKSTQVPQFILDSYAHNGNATDCNILVSQPRKISAISLADRVAHERNEILGDVVGYQVRLKNETPQEPGRILYCTTGILLRKLQCTPGLEGCSHVILDEAHERSIDTDVLMNLLRRAVDRNPDLKVLIMSATINAHLFQEYFNCPAIKVPGRLYPVEMNFMEDIENLPDLQKYKPYLNINYHDENSESLFVNYVKIVQIIKWISENKPQGAVLCFLPGWAEIVQVQKMLEDDPIFPQKQLLLPIHSKESHEAQRMIFQEVPDDTRKIILATDIAETGITVSDVCYVVDSAIHRDVRWDDTKDQLCLSNHWVSQANIQQRKGRAGRVRPGVSYHMIKRTEYDKLQEYPIARVLSTSLEKTILEIKSYTDEKAEVFLSGLLEPPSPSRIQKGVNYLIDLGVFDEEENLTALGKRMIAFPTHPKFSKALVYSAIFNCVHPVVSIVSVFSGEDSPFQDVLGEKSKLRKNKALYHPMSDHVAISWIFKSWYTYNSYKLRSAIKFCRKINLRHRKMETLTVLRQMFIQQMIGCRLLRKDDTHAYDNPRDAANKYENKDELVSAILYAATQQLIEHTNVGFKKGILRTNSNDLRIRGKFKAMISGESVNYKRKVWPSQYLTYFRGEHCDTKHRTVIRESSMVSPLTVLLFNQKEIQRHERDDRTEMQINVDEQHTLNFTCDKRTADVLLKFRDVMWSVVQCSLEQGEVEDYGTRLITEYKDQLLQTLVKALDASSAYTYDTQATKDNNDNDKASM
ncbi:PREDICTED: putative ATP-dependent RNA helicase DHX30 isoform X2 [Dinoponera quadriceps]|uniref:RNA helicase n=1 Tax=Dinoponera quadriceps TaxID=609295 RepID=A0A6P3XII1_DINQU|nr:PREDICTED: putative ATP-dependent RNA helicase DHX30 isoform X2 [Dinoponera quadriceps]